MLNRVATAPSYAHFCFLFVWHYRPEGNAVFHLNHPGKMTNMHIVGPFWAHAVYSWAIFGAHFGSICRHLGPKMGNHWGGAGLGPSWVPNAFVGYIFLSIHMSRQRGFGLYISKHVYIYVCIYICIYVCMNYIYVYTHIIIGRRRCCRRRCCRCNSRCCRWSNTSQTAHTNA
jgi:hypothetical protein